MADNHPPSAIVAQRARDADGSRFTRQALVCPLTDCDLDTAPYVGFRDHHAPDISDRTRSEASPPQDYLAGLPPAVVLTSTTLRATKGVPSITWWTQSVSHLAGQPAWPVKRRRTRSRG